MTAEALAQRIGAHARHALELEGFRRAAVLVPVIERPGGLSLLLIERTLDLPSHAGQIAFPGGKLDECDSSPVACALREAAEELALRAADVRVLGLLDDIPTVRSGFVITPVVGFLAGEPMVTPNPNEVAGYFYATLTALGDPAILDDQGARHWNGLSFRMLAFRLEGRNIWGATALIIQQLLELAR